MVISNTSNLRQIHVTLLELAREDDMERGEKHVRATEEHLQEAIVDTVGLSERTVRKYKTMIESGKGDVLKFYGDKAWLEDDDDGKVYFVRRLDFDDILSSVGESMLYRTNVQIPRYMQQARDAYGFRLGRMAERAMLDKLGLLPEVVGKFLNREVSEQETKYITALITYDLCGKGGSTSEQQKTQRMREAFYETIFDEEQHDTDGKEQLRRDALSVAEGFGIQPY